MKKIAMIIAGVVAMLGFALIPLMSAPVYAANCPKTLPASQQAGCAACLVEDDANNTWDDTEGKCNRAGNDLNNIIHTIINVMLFIVGILSVAMIIFGGIRYAASAGNKNAVDSAKNTIIYSIVGLVVAILAFAIVQWVFSSIT
jgi:heme/copper-type cytochrome/quinol oxidase subunit 2